MKFLKRWFAIFVVPVFVIGFFVVLFAILKYYLGEGATTIIFVLMFWAICSAIFAWVFGE